MYRPTFSLVIPNYNDADDLPNAIDAMLNQSHEAAEIIVVDDGSTDGSVELVKHYEKEHTNVKLIQHSHNQGVQAAIQTAVNAATSDFIYLGAADDQILPGFIQQAFELASSYPETGIIFGAIKVIDEEGNELGARKASQFDTSGWISPERFLTEYMVHEGPQHSQCSGTVYRKEAFLKWGGYRPELGPWCDTFIAQVLGLRYGACYINAPVASWTTAENTYSRNAAMNPHIGFKIIENAAQLMLDENHKSVFPTAYVSGWQERAYQEIIEQSALIIFQACKALNKSTSIQKMLILGKCHPHWVQYFQRYAECEIDYISQDKSHPYSPVLESVALPWDTISQIDPAVKYDLILVPGEKVCSSDESWPDFSRLLKQGRMVFLTAPGNRKLLDTLNKFMLDGGYSIDPKFQAEVYKETHDSPSSVLRHSRLYCETKLNEDPQMESIANYQDAFDTMTGALTLERKKLETIRNACFEGPCQPLGFSPELIEHDEGFGYTLSFRTHLGKFLLATGSLNRMLIFEDGQELPGVDSSTDSISETGSGRYCITDGRLLVSSTDNSDPRSNGKVYSIYAPSSLFLIENLKPEMRKKLGL